MTKRLFGNHKPYGLVNPAGLNRDIVWSQNTIDPNFVEHVVQVVPVRSGGNEYTSYTGTHPSCLGSTCIIVPSSRRGVSFAFSFGSPDALRTLLERDNDPSVSGTLHGIPSRSNRRRKSFRSLDTLDALFVHFLLSGYTTMKSFFLRSPGFSLLHPVDLTHRILQANSTYTNEGDGQKESQDDAYEFVAFLLWYIFLVMCCVIPTCCAYRRRRMLEQRLADYQNNMQHSNSLFVLSNFQPGPHMRHRSSEQIQQERLVLLREELKATTMTIKAENLEQSQNSKHDNYPITEADEAEPSKSDDAAASAMEHGEFNYTEDCGIVRLPIADGVNSTRTVQGVCTICLCAYEDGDQITWSTEASCQHAFHTECIVQWLAKKEEPRCPVCRQEFCPAAVVTGGETFAVDLERENSFLQSFSHALALSQLYRPYNSDPPTNYDPTRRAAITIQLANLAMENQTHPPNASERMEALPEDSTPSATTESAVPISTTGTTNTEPISDSAIAPSDRV